MKSLTCSRLAAALAALGLGAAAQAAAIPLDETFDDDSANIGTSTQPSEQGETWALFEEGSLGQTWSLENDTTTSGTTDYQFAVSRTTGSGFAQMRSDRYLSFSGADDLDGQDFTFSTEFEVDAALIDGGFAIAGLGLFADYGSGNAAETGYAVDFFLDENPADGDRTGELRIISTSGTLTLDATLTNQSTNAFVNTSATDSSPETGDDFSLRNRFGSNSGTGIGMNVDFDNVTLIPEPASLALLGLGGVLMLPRRTRR